MRSIEKNQTDPLVAILLVLYNEEQHIPQLLDSIKNQTYRKLAVFAIDNNSSDNSVSLFESLMPNAFIFRSKINNGYAKGNNLIAEKAVNNGADYLFILNTDMELDKKCINELVNLAESNTLIGGIAPLILKGKNKTDIIQSYALVANFKTARTASLNSNLNFSNNKLPERIEVNTIHGGATFIRTEVYKKIGLFNEDNFMYGDELDLAYRLKKTRYKMMVTKKAVALHFHDWSKNNKEGYYLQYFYMTRNRYLFFHRYKKYSSLLIESLKEIIKLPLTIRWLIKKADFKLVKYYYLGIIHGLLNRKEKANIEFK